MTGAKLNKAVLLEINTKLTQAFKPMMKEHPREFAIALANCCGVFLALSDDPGTYLDNFMRKLSRSASMAAAKIGSSFKVEFCDHKGDDDDGDEFDDQSTTH